MTDLPRVLCIVGPTSSGKTSLGIALAKKFDGEVINADARQIYRGFDIGTGKPSEEEREGIPHHLMSFVEPTRTFTVAEWRIEALALVRSISSRGKLPIIVGGTGLYIQALIDNYQIPSVPPQPEFRATMEGRPLEELVRLLREKDPEAAETVDLKNPRRVLRALEVVTFTGASFSSQRTKEPPVVEALMLAPLRTKEELDARIDAAVDRMIERGWIEEIRGLHAEGVAWDAPAMTSIGYRELGAFVRGECSLEEAVRLTKRATRQYAKRQMTWFKRDERIQWVKPPV